MDGSSGFETALGHPIGCPLRIEAEAYGVEVDAGKTSRYGSKAGSPEKAVEVRLRGLRKLLKTDLKAGEIDSRIDPVTGDAEADELEFPEINNRGELVPRARRQVLARVANDPLLVVGKNSGSVR